MIYVSGSMSDYNKLDLLKKAFRLLVHQLRPDDRVAIVLEHVWIFEKPVPSLLQAVRGTGCVRTP